MKKKDFVASKNRNSINHFKLNIIDRFSFLWTLTRKLNYKRFLFMELQCGLYHSIFSDDYLQNVILRGKKKKEEEKI